MMTDGRAQILSLAALRGGQARDHLVARIYARHRCARCRSSPRLPAFAEIYYKDEAGRFGLGSFKALGGAYAVFKLLRQADPRANRRHPFFARPDVRKVCRPNHDQITVTSATDGNHGRSVAWGAQTFGCRCVIYVHETVSEGRCRAIAAYGAEVRRVAGTFDDAVRRAGADAAAQGWHVVFDTVYEGHTDVPRDVMQGYSLMADEALAQTDGVVPSHVFVQGGVGGLAAGMCSYLWERCGAARPRFVRGRAGPSRLFLSQRRRGKADAGGGHARYHHGRPRVRRGVDPGVANSELSAPTPS